MSNSLINKKAYIANYNNHPISQSFSLLKERHQQQMLAALFHTAIEHYHNKHIQNKKLTLSLDYAKYKEYFNWSQTYYKTAKADFQKINMSANYTRYLDPLGSFKNANCFTEITYYKRSLRNKEGYPSVSFTLTPDFAAVISKIGNFQQLKLAYYKIFKSKYSTSLYYFLFKKKYIPKIKLDINELRKRLVIEPNKYKRNIDFHIWVIEKAITDLNTINFWNIKTKLEKDSIIFETEILDNSILTDWEKKEQQLYKSKTYNENEQLETKKTTYTQERDETDTEASDKETKKTSINEQIENLTKKQNERVLTDEYGDNERFSDEINNDLKESRELKKQLQQHHAKLEKEGYELMEKINLQDPKPETDKKVIFQFWVNFFEKKLIKDKKTNNKSTKITPNEKNLIEQKALLFIAKQAARAQIEKRNDRLKECLEFLGSVSDTFKRAWLPNNQYDILVINLKKHLITDKKLDDIFIELKELKAVNDWKIKAEKDDIYIKNLISNIKKIQLYNDLTKQLNNAKTELKQTFKQFNKQYAKVESLGSKDDQAAFKQELEKLHKKNLKKDVKNE